jgi:hypothetical protein
MATESSPFPEEEELEEDAYEELLALLALALLAGTSGIVMSTFSFSDFGSVQGRFRTKASEVLSKLSDTSQKSIGIGLERTSREIKKKDLSIDYSDPRIQSLLSDIFDNQLSHILQTNSNMFNELLIIADDRGWDDKEIARRLKLYYGLTPRYLRTVLAMEDALKGEGLSKKVIEQRIQKRIDQLVEVRFRLASTMISTGIVEGAKDAAFTQLVETGQLERGEYVKQWVSVLDDVTTDTCVSNHRTFAEIGQTFPSGDMYPPATNPVHPCRSSMRIIKRPN